MKPKTYTIGEFVKECKKEGLKVNGPTVIEFFVQKGYLRRTPGTIFTLPTDESYQQQYMSIQKIRINNYTHVHAVITEKGLDYFIPLLCDHFKVPKKLF